MIGQSSEGEVAAPLEVIAPPGTTTYIISNLRLTTRRPTPAQHRGTGYLLKELADAPEGSLLVLCGDSFDPTSDLDFELTRAVETNADFILGLRSLQASNALRIILLPGPLEPSLDLEETSSRLSAAGLTLESARSMVLVNGIGARRTRILVDPNHGSADEMEAASDTPPEAFLSSFLYRVSSSADIFAGIDRLAYRSDFSTFIVSRLFYRRGVRYLPLLLTPILVSLFFRFPFLSRVGQSHAVANQRILIIGLSTLAEAAVVFGLALFIIRRLLDWIGTATQTYISTSDRLETILSASGKALPQGVSGVVTAKSMAPYLAAADGFFVAVPGATGSAIYRYRARLSLPEVFIETPTATWLEIESGALAHIRLVGTVMQPSLSLPRRTIAKVNSSNIVRTGVLGSYPHGPNFPELSHQELRKSLLARRVSYVLLLILGIVNILSAVTPPLRSRFSFITEFIPTAVPTYANALTAVAGVAILALATGIRRGQRRAFLLTVGVASFAVVSNLLKGGDIEESTLLLLLVGYLLYNRSAFTKSALREISITRWVRPLVMFLALILISFASLESYLILKDRPLVPFGTALLAVIERFAGVTAVAIPHQMNTILTPTLFLCGLFSIGYLLFGIFNPYLDQITANVRSVAGQHSEPSSILQRSSKGTLDYFALRDDKRHHIESGTLIAFAEYGSTCIVSPDPIGPDGVAPAVFARFLSQLRSEGKSIAILGAGESWLGIYRSLGLHSYYIGDEAIVDVRLLTLEGGRNKSLRQAVNRMRKYGYTVEFRNPLDLSEGDREGVERVLTESRRGGAERGFSMTLGRVFDDRDKDLLLSICRSDEGRIVGFCQWVPAPGIGGYSLDVMRREVGEHPNGLIDLLIVETIMYLRDQGYSAISLNFAAMRATLAGERGDGITQKVERWMLRRLSDSMQIESLWRFNSKFDPSWAARYLVYDNPEDLPSVVVAVAKAESLWEIPIVGRFMTGPRT